MAVITAALVGTNLGYLLLTFLPPVLWLIFYLREDRHPEPKRLLLLVFIGGMGAALLAIFGECVFAEFIGGGSCQKGVSYSANPILLFLGIALIEEYVKYCAIKMLILRRPDFDEPVDAMIYMMTAAMGFAAFENALFVFPLLGDNFLTGLQVTAHRFLGANLLHALSSGIVGFFLARAWFHPRRHHFIALGIGIAAVLHAAFNYLILIREVLSQATLYVIFLLAVMAVMVFIDFERLKRTKIVRMAPPIPPVPPISPAPPEPIG